MDTPNLARLRELMGGDAEMAGRFVDLFREEAPRQLDELQNQLEQEEWIALSNTAHALKSQCRYLGLSELAALAEVIERGAESAPFTSRLPLRLQQLRLGLQAVLKQLAG